MWILLGLLTSCHNDIDIDPPFLQHETLSHTPSKLEVCGESVNNGVKATGGEKINFRITCKDNNALSQFKLDIHNNFDCHGHGSVVVPAFPTPLVNNQTEDFNNQTIFQLKGNDTTFILSIPIPEQVTAGNYHIGFQLIDIEGNAAESIYLDSQILNPFDSIPPLVKITNENSIPRKIKRGETLEIKGLFSDNRPLGSGGNGVVFLNYTSLSSGNSFSTDSFISMDDSPELNTTFTFNFVVPTFLIKGEYKFTVAGVDGVRNISEPVEYIITLE